MSRKWLIGLGAGLLAMAVLLTVGVTAYQLGEDRSERVLVTGSETLNGRVLVDHDGWHRGGPGFLILPLLILGAVLLLTSRRRHGWYGPGDTYCRYPGDRDRPESPAPPAPTES